MPDAKQQALFQELILDHYRRPRNRRALERASGVAARRNPACGEHVEAAVALEGGVVREAAFTGAACSIATAAASMLTDALVGRTRDDIAALLDRYRAMLRGDATAAADPALGELHALAGVARYPARVRCALLPADAFEAAVRAAVGGAPDVPRAPDAEAAPTA